MQTILRSLMVADAAPTTAAMLAARKMRLVPMRRWKLTTEQVRRSFMRHPTASDARPLRPIHSTVLPHCSTPPHQCKQPQMGALRQHQIPRWAVQRAPRSEAPRGAHQARTRGVHSKRTSFAHTPHSSTGLWTRWQMAAEVPNQSLAYARAVRWRFTRTMRLAGVSCSRHTPWVVPAMFNLPRMAPRVTAGQRTACRARKASATRMHPTGQDQTVQDQTAYMLRRHPSTQVELTTLTCLHPDRPNLPPHLRPPLLCQRQCKVMLHTAMWHVLAPLQLEHRLRRPGLF